MWNSHPDKPVAKRFSIYFLLDCSGTMQGDRIASVRRGVNAICNMLKRDPRSARLVHIGVIWFNDEAYEAQLVSLSRFALPEDLRALGKTALGKALDRLDLALTRDAGNEDEPSPLVFLLTDGKPDPGWEAPAERLRNRTTRRPYIIGLAIGADAESHALTTIADVVLTIESDFTHAIADYFNWAGEAVIAAQGQETLDNSGRTTQRLPPFPGSVSVRLNRTTTD